MESYRYITEVSEAQDVIPQIAKFPRVGTDTETFAKEGYTKAPNYNTFTVGTGKNQREVFKAVDPRTCDIRLLQMATPEEVYMFDCQRIPVEVFKPLLESKEIEWIFHHGAFDLQFLLKHDIRPPKVFDTMLALQVIEAGIGREFGLADGMDRVLGIKLDKTEQSSDWSGKLTDSQLTYGAKDVRHLIEFRNALFQVAKEDGLTTTLSLEFNALPAFAYMMYKGAYLDVPKIEKIGVELTKEIKVHADRLMEIANGLDIKKNEKFLNSYGQLLDAFHALGLNPIDPMTDKPSTAKAAIMNIDHPFAQELMAYKKLHKLLTAFLYKLPDLVHPVSQCIHASLRQIGADTGRSSCASPNLNCGVAA